MRMSSFITSLPYQISEFFLAEARGRQLDEATWNKVLNPIFKGKERKMVKTIFDEREAVGEARGEAKAGRELVLRVLRKKFKKVPKDIEAKVLSKNDPIALASLAEHVIDSSTLEEFAEGL